MTPTSTTDEMELVKGCANSPFEELVLLALKEFGKTIRNLEARISFLENKMIM